MGSVVRMDWHAYDWGMMTTTLVIVAFLLVFWCFVRVVTQQGPFESKSQALAREAFVREFPCRTIVSTRCLKTINSADIVAVEFLEPGVVSEPHRQEIYNVRSNAEEVTRIEAREVDEYGLMIPK